VCAHQHRAPRVREELVERFAAEALI